VASQAHLTLIGLITYWNKENLLGVNLKWTFKVSQCKYPIYNIYVLLSMTFATPWPCPSTK
jgi:hypothetical protein